MLQLHLINLLLHLQIPLRLILNLPFILDQQLTDLLVITTLISRKHVTQLLVLGSESLLHISLLVLELLSQLVNILLNPLQFLLEHQMDFLSLNHHGLLAFDHLEIKFLDVLIHLRNTTLMDEHHVIDQPSHLDPILLFLHHPVISLLPPHIYPQSQYTSILHTANQVLLVMWNHQTRDRQGVDLGFVAVREF